MILEFNSDPAELKNIRQKVEDFCRDNLIKGNILNIKDSNSVVFGYFKVCEFDEFMLEDIIID